ncbi:MAG TPA: DUF3488 and transglutaminase-like domain-containing protein [Terriglobales bacterium]|nr:DUF3488 and transglutaminase-like domain-containing protein [Terriglobales bacterium]
MPSNAPTITRAAHPVIQRFFDISLFFLLFTGFAILAGTGKLDLLSLLFGISALLAKGYLLVRKIDVTLPEQWTTYFTLIYLVFFALDYFLISQTFIGSLIHMVLFAAMVKVFSIHRDRDYVYLALLSFGMVLAAAVLTVDSLFFGLFCVFVLLAVTTFVSMEMRRSWIGASASAPTEARELRDLRRLPGSVVRACLLLVISIVLGTIALFFLIPRKASAGYLSALSSRGDLSTGFSEEVRLGEIGQLQQSNAVMMHVKFAPGVRVPNDLRWRGVAFTTFDGRRWSTPHENITPEPMNPTWALGLAASNHRLFAGSGQRVRYKVSLEPFGSRVFFVLPQAESINGRYQAIRIDSTGSILNADNSRSVSDYVVTSEIAPPMPDQLPPTPEVGLSEIVYLKTPSNLDPRIRQLAEQVAAGQDTPFLRAVAIERYLATSYRYTLQLPSTSPKDPVANFLFERKVGHCEYFASSMAVMLRTLGIPARTVNGFRGGEYNDVTGSYIVRAKDAHSWVEAYFSGYGWYTFDPTPASSSTSPDSWSRLYLYADAMREFWHDWVVNYDPGHQSVVGSMLVRQSRLRLDLFRNGMQSLYEGSVRRARALRTHFQQHQDAWTLWLACGLTLSMLLLVGPRALRLVRRLRITQKPTLEPHTAATIWYTRLLKLLSRRGIRKPPSQTPQEFLEALRSHPAREPAARFTAHYERARFGHSADDAEKLPELYREVEAVSKEK